MFQKITILFVLACGLLLSAVDAQDVDCSKRPERIMDPQTCCTPPEMFNDELMEKCKEFAAPGPHHGPPHHYPCFMECILNKTEVYVNDEVNEAKLSEFLGDASDFQPIIIEAFATCAAKSKEFEAKREEWMKNKPAPPAGDNPKCNHSIGFLLKCVQMESFKKCPSERWNDSQVCNDLREHMQNCKPEHGPHGKWRGPDADN